MRIIMRYRLFYFLLAASLFAATDPWTKLRDLKTGGDVRVYKTGSKQAITGIFDEATDENLIVVVKNEQKAIPKTDIERIDYRAPSKGSRATKESKTVTKDPDTAAPRIAGMPPAGPSTSSGSSVSFGGKGDFETVYRRLPAAK
jgi:hypothetical protein